MSQHAQDNHNDQVMVMGGLGEEHSVMKLVLGQNNWYSVPPMSFPRVQVRTMKKTMTSWYFVFGVGTCQK